MSCSSLRGEVTPARAPDGSRIAFASEWHGNFKIYTTNPEGTHGVWLTNTPEQELSVGLGPAL